MSAAAVPLVFCAAFCLVFGLWVVVRGTGESRSDRVLRRIRSEESPVAQIASPTSILRDGGATPLLKRSLQRLPFTERVQKLLDQADLSVSAGPFVLAVVLLAGFGVMMGWVVAGHLGQALLFGLLLGALPYVVVRVKRGQRMKQFIAQFPDALELMSSSLRAGHAFTASLGLVAEEMPDPISSEFRRVFEEQNYGMRLEDALGGLAHRIESLDAKFFTMAVVIQKETGGNMAEIMDNIGQTIRERFKIVGQVQTLTAQGRLSGWVLGFLPLGLGLALYLMNPDYIGMLFEHPLGKKLLGVAAALQVIGFLIVRKIIDIKV